MDLKMFHEERQYITRDTNMEPNNSDLTFI
jgi:hypothetical protein